MFQVPTNFKRFTVVIGIQITIISVQIFILAFGYGFLGVVAYLQYLAPPDSVCEFMRSYPAEVTMIVTLIATMLSVTAATYVYLFLPPTYHQVRCDFFFHQSFHAFGQTGTKTSNVEADPSNSSERWCRFGTGLSYTGTSIYRIDRLNAVYPWDAEALNGRVRLLRKHCRDHLIRVIGG
jgi:hypothetical protein